MIALFISLLFWKPNKSNAEYFYKTNAQFLKEQQAKRPELAYEILYLKYKIGEISKEEYEKSIDSLIKDISI